MSETCDVAIVGAMADETVPMLRLADWAGAERQLGSVTFRIARYGATRTLVVASGIGLANAASAATIALLEASPRAVLSIGSAGGIGDDVRVGQIAIGSEYSYAKADARAFGYELGQVPQMPVRYAADPALLAAALRIAEAQVDDPRWPQAPEEGLPEQMDLRPAPAHVAASRAGLVLSSDVFVTAPEAAAALEAFPQALSIDMESTAIAQVCHRFAVPFLSVRAISDLCGPRAGGDFLAHIDDAAERSALFARDLIAARPLG